MRRFVCALLVLSFLLSTPALAGGWWPRDILKVGHACWDVESALHLVTAWGDDGLAVEIAYRLLTRSGDCYDFEKPQLAQLVEPLHQFMDYRGVEGTIWAARLGDSLMGTPMYILIPTHKGPHDPT